MSNDTNISSDDLLKILQDHPELHESLGMKMGPRIVWDILFGGMLFVAVVGNLIVLWIVVGKHSRSVNHMIIHFFEAMLKLNEIL